MDSAEKRPSGKLGNYLITLVIEAVCGLFRFAILAFFAVAVAYGLFATTVDPSAFLFGGANPDSLVQPALDTWPHETGHIWGVRLGQEQ